MSTLKLKEYLKFHSVAFAAKDILVFWLSLSSDVASRASRGLIRIFAFDDRSYLASNASRPLDAKSSISLLGNIPDPLTIFQIGYAPVGALFRKHKVRKNFMEAIAFKETGMFKLRITIKHRLFWSLLPKRSPRWVL